MPCFRSLFNHPGFFLVVLFALLASNANRSAWAADGLLVSVGYFHTCAIKADATVVCWGGIDAAETAPPEGEFVQISAGAFHNCGVQKNGNVECWWGYNFDGEASPPEGTFSQVSAGIQHTCGIRIDGTIACWGFNFSGESNPPPGASFTQISVGDSYSCGLHASGAIDCWGNDSSGQSSPPAGTSFVQISAGAFHICGLHNDGRVECWGDQGQGRTNPPSGTFSQISSGRFHTCGVRSDSAVVCWGDNSNNQSTPPIGAFLQVSSGQSHTCGVRINGDISCWGDNDTGRIIPKGGQFSQISTGDFHACGITLNGDTACWGSDTSGQSSPPDGEFTQISAGSLHTCGLHANGRVTCWGDDNWNGQASPPDGTFTQVSAGSTHSCGLLSGGSIVCWGDDTYGQANPPQGIFLQVSAGSAHTCGLRNDNTVDCWGSDGFGAQASSPNGTFAQISAGEFSNCGLRFDGSIECWGDSSFIEPRPSNGAFIQVSAGRGSFISGEHSCGVRSSGIVECWGKNEHGQATPPGGIFSAVSVGIQYTCGLRNDGIVECWGFNGHGYAVAPEELRSDPGLFQPPSISFDESHLLNVSTNGKTTGFGMRAGFIVQGQDQRFVIMGENMGGMQNPLLKLFNLSNNTLIEQNDDWQSHPTASEVQSTLRMPGNSRDGAFAITLPQGLYYAELQDESGSGQGLVSVTASDANNFQQTYPINFSTRGPSPLTAGFIVDGDSARCFIIKAEGVGPLGSGALPDPALVVRDFQTGEIIDANNNWADHPSAEMVQIAGFAPSNEREAALAVRLPQGQYLAELYSVFEAEEGGDSIVAITELPENFLDQASCDTTRITNATPQIQPNDIKAVIKQPLSAASNYYESRPIPYQGEVITNASGTPIYQWEFGDGAQLSAGNSTDARNGVVRYGRVGTKTVRLTVTVNGQSDTKEVTINVRERRPPGDGKG